MCAKLLELCLLTLGNAMDCGPSGSFVCGILQARILEWVGISFSRGSSRPRDGTHISCIGRWVLHHYHHLGSPHPPLAGAISTSLVLCLLPPMAPGPPATWERHQGTCKKWKFPRVPLPQTSWKRKSGWDPAISVPTSSPGGSDAHQRLRTTATRRLNLYVSEIVWKPWGD